MMRLSVMVPLWALLSVSQQTPPDCVCELLLPEGVFPHQRLRALQDNVSNCNTEITPRSSFDLESLLLGLDRRLPQLLSDLQALERQKDQDLHGALSLFLIQNELAEIQQLLDSLNGTIQSGRQLSHEITRLLQDVRAEMQELEQFDTQQVVKQQQANQRLKRDLDQCRNGPPPTAPPPTGPPNNTCPFGRLVGVTGPVDVTPGEYPGSFKYGAWGRDPKPEPGKENWYWLVPMTSNNRYSNFVRLYSSLSSLIVGKSTPGNVQLHASNPTTNTIQGPNVVLHAGRLFYNCYNTEHVCVFNLTSKEITRVELPKGTRFNSKGNYCHLDECYPFTDLDLATDESGVWVIYTSTKSSGNLLLSRVEDGDPPRLGRTWSTSVYKQAVTNAFVACGVLYATRFVDGSTEEIFYSLDTATGSESFNVGIPLPKVSPGVLSLNYSPLDQMLHAYCDSQMVSYKVLFESTAGGY